MSPLFFLEKFLGAARNAQNIDQLNMGLGFELSPSTRFARSGQALQSNSKN